MTLCALDPLPCLQEALSTCLSLCGAGRSTRSVRVAAPADAVRAATWHDGLDVMRVHEQHHGCLFVRAARPAASHHICPQLLALQQLCAGGTLLNHIPALRASTSIQAGHWTLPDCIPPGVPVAAWKQQPTRAPSAVDTWWRKWVHDPPLPGPVRFPQHIPSPSRAYTTRPPHAVSPISAGWAVAEQGAHHCRTPLGTALQWPSGTRWPCPLPPPACWGREPPSEPLGAASTWLWSRCWIPRCGAQPGRSGLVHLPLASAPAG